MINFQRSFDRQNKDTWKIDGKKITGKEYLREIQKFNIQVDNLCMFLPQDRVQDFTKLNAQDLLLNTMSSVSSAETNEAFEKLKELRTEQKTNSTANNELKKHLDDHLRRNEILKAQIESNKRKDELIERENVLLVKKSYLECVAIKSQLDELDKDAAQMKAVVAAKDSELQPLQREQKQHVNQKNSLQSAVSTAGAGVVQSVNELTKLKESVGQAESAYNREKQKLKNAKQSLEDQNVHIKDTKLLVEVQKNDLRNAESEQEKRGDVAQEMREIDQNIDQTKDRIEQLMQHRSKITQNIEETISPAIRNCQRKINMMSDTARQKAEALKNLNEDAFKAYEWLKVNKHQFNSEVFFPPIIELTVKNKEYAKYIENTIALRDLTAFICTDIEDNRKLFNIFRKEKKWEVNTAVVELRDDLMYHPATDISEYPSQLGLQTFMIDVLEGPTTVLNHLCKLFSLHQVAIGDDRTFNNASQVPNDIRVFFSTNHRFAVTISKYSGERSMSANEIHGKNLLNVGIDPRAREHEENNLKKWRAEGEKKQAELQKFESQISQYEGTMNEMRTKKKSLQKLSENVQKCRKLLERREIELQNLIDRKIDMKVEQMKFRKAVDDLVNQKLKLAKQQVTKLIQLKKNSIAKVIATTKYKLFQQNTGNLDHRINEILISIQNTKNVLNTIENRATRVRAQFDSKKEETKELAGGIAPSNKKYRHYNEFMELTSNIGELQNMIEDMQGRIACIPGIDPAIVQEYERRYKQIEILQGRMKMETNRQSMVEQEMKDLHDQWYPEINVSFVQICSGFYW